MAVVVKLVAIVVVLGGVTVVVKFVALVVV